MISLQSFGLLWNNKKLLLYFFIPQVMIKLRFLWHLGPLGTEPLWKMLLWSIIFNPPFYIGKAILPFMIFPLLYHAAKVIDKKRTSIQESLQQCKTNTTKIILTALIFFPMLWFVTLRREGIIPVIQIAAALLLIFFVTAVILGNKKMLESIKDSFRTFWQHSIELIVIILTTCLAIGLLEVALANAHIFIFPKLLQLGFAYDFIFDVILPALLWSTIATISVMSFAILNKQKNN